MKNRRRDLATGFLVLVSLLLLGALILYFGEFGDLFQKTYTVSAYFSNARGMRRGVAVRMAGVNIGKVTRIELAQADKLPHPVPPNHRVRVDLALDATQPVTVDSELWLEEHLMLGETYLEFKGGTSTENLKHGTSIVGHIHASPLYYLEELSGKLQHITQEIALAMQNIRSFIEAPETQKDLKTTLSNAASFSSKLNELATKFNDITDRTALLIGDIDAIASTVQVQLAVLPESIDQVLRYVEQKSDTIDRFLESIDNVLVKGQGTLGQVITSDEMYDRALRTLDRLDAAAAEAEQALLAARCALRSYGAFADQLRERPGQLFWGTWGKGETKAVTDPDCVRPFQKLPSTNPSPPP